MNTTQYNAAELNQPRPNVAAPMQRDTARAKGDCKLFKMKTVPVNIGTVTPREKPAATESRYPA